jgi:hypothetical protein
MPPLPGGFDFNRIYVKSLISQTPSGGWLYELGVKGPIENGWYRPERREAKDRLELYYRDWQPVADIYCWMHVWYARDRTKINKEMAAEVIVKLNDEGTVSWLEAKNAVEMRFGVDLGEDEMERSRR